MNELKPIDETEQTNELKPIETDQNEKQEVSLPILKNNPEEIISNLPEWSIEPPIEIKRN